MVRKSLNPKRRIVRQPVDEVLLFDLSVRVRYGGNPEHKRHPGDFDLHPPSSPHPDSTLCDGVGIFEKTKALALLRAGILQGLISAQFRGEFPQNVWAVTEDGKPLEAQLENETLGQYHGYPLTPDDPIAIAVTKSWRVP